MKSSTELITRTITITRADISVFNKMSSTVTKESLDFVGKLTLTQVERRMAKAIPEGFVFLCAANIEHIQKCYKMKVSDFMTYGELIDEKLLKGGEE